MRHAIEELEKRRLEAQVNFNNTQLKYNQVKADYDVWFANLDGIRQTLEDFNKAIKFLKAHVARGQA